MKPLFSIITISLNNLRGLAGTARSLPDRDDYEWIVVDGGSIDGTDEWLNQTNVSWISEPDDGIYDAMNKGIAWAQGDYLLFLNAGDELADHGVLNRLTQAIKDAGRSPDFVYGDSLESRAGHAPAYKKARSHDGFVYGMFTHHQAMLYRRGALGSLRYDTSYKIAADYKFTVRFLKKASGILYCPFPLCLFEPGGLSQKQMKLGRREQFNIRRDENFCSPVRNITVFAGQSIAMGLRRIAPSLYWRFRQTGWPRLISR